MTKTTTKQNRRSIKQHANEHGCRYRITCSGEVHYYGKMPNSNLTGWFFMAHDASELARYIRIGKV